VSAPLTQREFVEWFRDKHMINGRRLKFVLTLEGEVINLDQMDDDQAQLAAEQIMMMDSHFEGRA
jgi:hypothetical protein